MRLLCFCMWWASLGKQPNSHPTAHSLSPSVGRVEEWKQWQEGWEISCVEMKTGRSLTTYHYTQNNLDLGKINFIKTNLGNEKTSIKTTPFQTQDDEEQQEGYGQYIPVSFSCSFFLIPFCFSMGCSPSGNIHLLWHTVLHRPQQTPAPCLGHLLPLLSPLTLVFSLLSLRLFVPPPLSVWHFFPFLNQPYHCWVHLQAWELS